MGGHSLFLSLCFGIKHSTNTRKSPRVFLWLKAGFSQSAAIRTWCSTKHLVHHEVTSSCFSVLWCCPWLSPVLDSHRKWEIKQLEWLWCKAWIKLDVCLWPELFRGSGTASRAPRAGADCGFSLGPGGFMRGAGGVCARGWAVPGGWSSPLHRSPCSGATRPSASPDVLCCLTRLPNGISWADAVHICYTFGDYKYILQCWYLMFTCLISY